MERFFYSQYEVFVRKVASEHHTEQILILKRSLDCVPAVPVEILISPAI